MPRRDHSSVHIDRSPTVWEAIGDRRSIRYFQAYRPVERWKIEVMFPWLIIAPLGSPVVPEV